MVHPLAMKDPLEPERCAELLGALAAPERLQIIRLLRVNAKNVTELAEELKLSIVNTSHHLGVLRHAGLVRRKRQGRFVLYSLPPNLMHIDNADARTKAQLDLGCCRLEMPIREE